VIKKPQKRGGQNPIWAVELEEEEEEEVKFCKK
jgi:hypothetical protein